MFGGLVEGGYDAGFLGAGARDEKDYPRLVGAEHVTNGDAGHFYGVVEVYVKDFVVGGVCVEVVPEAVC